MMPQTVRPPRRGEIWWTNLPTDPPEKGRRPVIIVSPDGRNQHSRARSVLVIPLSTSIQRLGPAHLLLRAGETGLNADSAAQAANIATVRREGLSAPAASQRVLSHARICRLADMVRLGMGCA